MIRVAKLLSLAALAIAAWRVFALGQQGSHIFRPSWTLVFFLPCASALVAFITPEKPWVAWIAWLANTLVGGIFLIMSLIYWEPLLFGPYAPTPLSLLQIAILFIVAPLTNALALRPWSAVKSD